MTGNDAADHGAVGDGITPDTVAVQRAIDSAHHAGGGTVLMPAGGIILVGSIELRSHVELHIETWAVLQGSPRWPDDTARFRVGALSAGITEGSETRAALPDLDVAPASAGEDASMVRSGEV